MKLDRKEYITELFSFLQSSNWEKLICGPEVMTVFILGKKTVAPWARVDLLSNILYLAMNAGYTDTFTLWTFTVICSYDLCTSLKVIFIKKIKTDSAGAAHPMVQWFLVHVAWDSLRHVWLRKMTDECGSSLGLHLGTRKLISKSIKVSWVIKLKIPLAQWANNYTWIAKFILPKFGTSHCSMAANKHVRKEKTVVGWAGTFTNTTPKRGLPSGEKVYSLVAVWMSIKRTHKHETTRKNQQENPELA